MPLEFRNSGCITDKNDVFGLGVLIIQLMDGKNGLTHFTEMSGERFIEHVCNKNYKEVHIEKLITKSLMETMIQM